MFKPSAATDRDSYLAALTPERKDIILFIDQFIRQTAPQLKPYFAYNMLGYGAFSYKNYKKETIQWPIISLASQKNYISLYVCALDQGEYVAEKYKKSLGKVNVGKSCIRFHKTSDLNLPVLKKVIQFAAKKPGLQP